MLVHRIQKSEIREKSSPAVTNMQIRQLREEAAQMSKVDTQLKLVENQF